MAVRLGDLLVKRGVLTQDQCDRVAAEQQKSGRPFGELAERLFGISESAVEDAWAEQYAGLAEKVDPRAGTIKGAVLELVTRRQAWQFRMIPLKREGQDVVICTTQDHLARALRFAGWHLGGAGGQCYFVLTDPEALGEALARYYPMGGMGVGAVKGKGFVAA
jgi:hypothetical protein